jgi:hypothetical protein
MSQLTIDNNAIPIDGLEQQNLAEGATMAPTPEPTTNPKKVKSPVKKVASPEMGLAAQNSWARKAPAKYAPSIKGNKYAIALIQISSL